MTAEIMLSIVLAVAAWLVWRARESGLILRKKLPDGYELRVVNQDRDGEFAKLAVFYRGKPIFLGKYLDIYGYYLVAKMCRRAAFAHHRNRVDEYLNDEGDKHA